MNKVNKVLKAAVLSVFFAAIIAVPTFAAFSDCMGQGKEYPGLRVVVGSGSAPAGWHKCTSTYDRSLGGGANNGGPVGTKVTIYGETSADCTQAATIVSNPDTCKTRDLNTVVQTIINTVIFVVGMLAVVMVIIGGFSYTMSQGDPNRVSKAKSTIMYGIIGLVVCLLAFAIVNFVLNALRSS